MISDKKYNDWLYDFECNIDNEAETFFDMSRNGFYCGPSHDIEYVPPKRLTFYRNCFPPATIKDFNLLVNRCISELLANLTISLLKDNRIKTERLKINRNMLKVIVNGELFYVFFTAYNYLYLDSENQLSVFKCNDGYKEDDISFSNKLWYTLNSKTLELESIDNSYLKNTIIVIGNALRNVKVNERTKKLFCERYKDVTTPLEFLSRYIDKDTIDDLYSRLANDVFAIIDKKIAEYTDNTLYIGAILSANNHMDLNRFGFLPEQFDTVLKGEIKKILKLDKKPYWCRSFETAEWLWYRFQNVYYFDNSFITMQYYKTFDIFFRNIVSKKIDIPEKSTLGDCAVFLKQNATQIGINKKIFDYEIRMKYFKLLEDYIEIRNKYTHSTINDKKQMVDSARNRTLELIALTMFFFAEQP